MKAGRREFLRLTVGVAALPAASRFAWAQAYPARPVRLIVGYPPGGSADITARFIGQWLSEGFGQQFVIENRPGAASNVGTEIVARSSADGYSLLLVNTANAINAALYDNLNFDFIRDIAPVASVSRNPLVIVVNPSFPAKTIPEFIAYAKANPGKISMASSGTGTILHVSGELFKMMTGIDMVHVPYKGTAPALTDLLGRQVQMMFSDFTAIEHIRAGKLRALAVTAATRLDVLPGIPTVSEFVPGYEASGFIGVGAPKNTPAEIVDKLNKAITVILVDPKMKARLAEIGVEPMPMTPADFGKFIADETEKLGKVIRAANIKAG